MEHIVRHCIRKACKPKLDRVVRSRTYSCIRPSAYFEERSRLILSTNSPDDRTQKLSSQTFTWNPHSFRKFSVLSVSLNSSRRLDKPRFDSVSCRNQTNEANNGDSEAYKSAMPFDSMPKVGGLSAMFPYLARRLLFKPFSKYPVEAVGHLISELHDTYGPVFRMRNGKRWVVHTDRLEDADTVLQPETHPYRDPIQIQMIFNERVKKRIFSPVLVNGQEWQRIRTPLNKKLSRPASLVYYLPSMEAVAIDFADRLYYQQDSPPETIADLFLRYTTESIGVLCFNKSLGLLAGDLDAFQKKLLTSYKTGFACITETLYGKRIMFRFYEDSFFKRYKEAKTFTMDFAEQCMQEALEEIERRKKEGTFDPEELNFLLSLLSEKDFTKEEIASMLDEIMTAGTDSTSCSLQLFFYTLATNEDKQEKLAEELLTHMGPDGHLTASVLEKLHYLKACVKESLRLNFPIPMGIKRSLPHNVVIGGYQVPKETSIIMSTPRIAHSASYYDRPDNFIPERWLRDQDKQRERAIDTRAYLPFGFGPRNCAGRQFALQEMHLAAAKVLQKYRIGLKADRPELVTIFNPFKVPLHPMPFTFTPRH